MKTNLKIIIALFLLSISLNGFCQGKIDESKKELKKGADDNSTTNESSSSSGESLSDKIIVEIVTKAFLYVTWYSFIGSYEDEDHLHNQLTKYPFYNKFSGNYESCDSVHLSEKTIRLDLEDKFLIGHPNLFGNHLKARLRPCKYFYFQADYFQLLESGSVVAIYSNLSLFNFNICYDRVRFEKFNLGWTLGANYVGNNVNRGGFSCGLNTEVFLLKPFSMYSSMKWGFVNSVTVNEFEVLCRYHKNNFFYSIGYEHLKIASPAYDFISVGGGIYF